MTVPLFGRSWALTISAPNVAKALKYASNPATGYPLQFNFDVSRTLHSEANKGKFVVSNLSTAHRALIGPGSALVLRAGYGAAMDIIFRGTVSKVVNAQEEGKFTTAIEAEDAGPILNLAMVHLSYRSTTTLAQILQDICAQLQVTIAGQVYKYQGHIVQKVPRVTLPRRVISGQCREVLDNLLHPLGMTWSIQCGTLLIQNSVGVVNLLAQVLSSKTGLIGIPSKTKTGVSLKTLLLPTVAPGLAVQVVSKDKSASGNFRIVAAKYSGDTHGADWTVEAEAEVLTYPLADYVKETSQGSFADAQQAAPEAGSDSDSGIFE